MDGKIEGTVRPFHFAGEDLLVAVPLDALIDTVRATAAMGQALVARVEEHRSAAAANRLGEHKVVLEQSLEHAARQHAELREKFDEVSAKFITAERERNEARHAALSEMDERAKLIAEVESERAAAAAELDAVKRERDDLRVALAQRAAAVAELDAVKCERDEMRRELDRMKFERDEARTARQALLDRLNRDSGLREALIRNCAEYRREIGILEKGIDLGVALVRYWQHGNPKHIGGADADALMRVQAMHAEDAAARDSRWLNVHHPLIPAERPDSPVERERFATRVVDGRGGLSMQSTQDVDLRTPPSRRWSVE